MLEIGPGWKATILNSATKFYIVLANMKGQGMVTDFYIGGSTDAADLTDDLGSGDDAVESDFEDYLPDSTGTYEITYYSHIINTFQTKQFHVAKIEVCVLCK